MIFFILTRAGYEDVKTLIGQSGATVWINKDILDSTELTSLRNSGIQVTNFTYNIALETAQVEHALDTIVEHHPKHVIWVEAWNE